MRNRGFTLIEVLMVILIISVLASIAIVSYREVRRNSYDIIALSDIKNIKTEIESEYYSTYNSYPVGNWDEIKDRLSVQASNNVQIRYQGSQTEYGLITYHSNGKKMFVSSNNTGHIWYKFRPCNISASSISGFNDDEFESNGWKK